MKQVLYILFFTFSILSAQTLSVQLFKLDHVCEKGQAGIQILSGKQPITTQWSNGASNTPSIQDLIEGDYSVTIKDSAQKDTVVNFTIEKLPCKVSIANHFTPNGDNYNDTWGLFQTEYHPRMKLYVYNKWGQQVHAQSGTYTPWNGTQGGIAVADGTYYYVFYYEASDEGNYIMGDVTILR